MGFSQATTSSPGSAAISEMRAGDAPPAQIVSLWAPFAKRVELKVGENKIPMDSGTGGWCSVEVPAAANMKDYGFIVDGEGPFPDPRSPWQPNGIYGLSRLYDQSSFNWTDAGWQAPPLSAAVIYELHIGTFTSAGSFESAIEKLDHLAELGITHIQLMPVQEFSGTRGWGYDGADLFAPHHAYGGPGGLKRFVDACHARRLAVLLDVVYNHLGPAGNYLSRFGPYFTDRYRIPWGSAINFDGPDSTEVRRFFCDNALMWLRDYHFDGLRVDAVHAIVDTSAEPFLEQLTREAKRLEAQLGRDLVIIAESDLNDPRLLWPSERGGFGFDAQWNDDFHHALHTVLTGESAGYYLDFGTLANLAKALETGFVYDGCYSKFRRRRHGRSPAGLSGDCFLGYLQNHDQIGNRAKGERASHLMGAGRLKIGAALVLTSPFVPMLFQGEEWGASTPFLYFCGHREPALAKAVSEGRRREFATFGWNPHDIADPQSEEVFNRSKLNWSEVSTQPHAELLQWHQNLIRLRRAEPALMDGRLDRVHTHYHERDQWLLVERRPITIVCNFTDRAQRVALPQDKHEVLLASEAAVVVEGGTAYLPSYTVAILKATF